VTHQCTGCPKCDDEMRRVMSLNLGDASDRERYCEWLGKKDRLRAAGARGQLRTNVHHPEVTIMDCIDPYAADIAKLVAAEATTPESRFAKQYAVERAREFAVTRVALDANVKACPLPRLTTAQLAEYKAPDGYNLSLKDKR
jgi:hypothetical protein